MADSSGTIRVDSVTRVQRRLDRLAEQERKAWAMYLANIRSCTPEDYEREEKLSYAPIRKIRTELRPPLLRTLELEQQHAT